MAYTLQIEAKALDLAARLTGEDAQTVRNLLAMLQDTEIALRAWKAMYDNLKARTQ